MRVGRSLFAIGIFLAGCHLVAPVPDLTSGRSGSADASTEGGTGSSPCLRNPAPSFCDDFDVGALGAKWTGQSLRDGELSLDPSISISPPNSLHAKVPADSNDYASLRRDVGKGRAISVELDLRIDQLSSRSAVWPLRILVVPGTGSGSPETDPNRYEAELRVSADTTELEATVYGGPAGEPLPRETFQLAQRILVGEWTHVRLDLDFAGSNPSAKVLLGGSVALDKPMNISFAAGDVHVVVGIASSSTFEAPAEDHVDGVVVAVMGA